MRPVAATGACDMPVIYSLHCIFGAIKKRCSPPGWADGWSGTGVNGGLKDGGVG